MQTRTKQFHFGFPITNFQGPRPIHVGDIEVHAFVYLFQDGTLQRDDNGITVDINSLTWEGSDIGLLVNSIAPDTYESIVEAARQLGKDKFEIPELSQKFIHQ